ncbi:MAG TPA: NYN domain-containing protein, partial [Firmicutes bacterium]|nr:NYN domain-containing protein [Bacillota bacterium]
MRVGRTMWLIDAAYLFNAQESAGTEYNFDYLKLRFWLERNGPIDDAWYLNSTQSPPSEDQSGFHAWLQT